MMQNIPLFGVGVRSISDIVTRQRRVNCLYDIRKDQDRTSIVLLGTPGSAEWVTLVDSPIRGWHVANSLLYICAASSLYAVTLSGVVTMVATGISEAGPVSIADNGNQLLIVTGGLGHVYQIQTGALDTIVDSFFPVGATSCVFLNGRFIVNNPGTRQFYVSGILDGLNWTYLGSSAIVGSKENSSDLLVRVSNLNGTLVLYGQQSIEFWQDVGTSPLPYQRINGATQSWGLAAPLSNVDVGNTEFFLGYAPNGGISVIRLDGYNPEPVSDSDLDTLFSSFSTVEDAVALTYTAYGHPIYQITFPTENRSFAYDVKTGIWHEAQTGVAEQGRHFAQYGITYGGRNYVSDSTSGTVYFLDKDIYTDNDELIKRQVVTRHIRNQGNELSISELFLDFETGVGTAPPVTPVGQIAYSVPGTYTFTVPDDVTSICAVVVGGGGSSADDTVTPVGGNPGTYSEISGVVTANGGSGASAFLFFFSSGGAGGGGTTLVPGVIGGGNGGNGGDGDGFSAGGGGGAGGYSGSGGSGGVTQGPGFNGSGGGGGGGASWITLFPSYSGDAAGGGGGVGILGQGADGAAGSATQASAGGGGGSGGAAGVSSGVSPFNGSNGGLYGGGGGANLYGGSGGGGGGGLRYINNYTVAPGSTLTVIVGAGGAAPGGNGGAGANGAVRIIWGPGRSFPSTLTADLPTQDSTTAEENPKVSLRISRDGGRTFGNERWVPLGKMGEYDARVILRRLGSARDFVVQITMTDPVKFVLASGSVSLESGDA
jgi:hypothetical protein